MTFELISPTKHFHLITSVTLNFSRVFFILLFLSTHLTTSVAQSVPEHGGRWVHDYADILSPQTEDQLEALLRAERDSTSNQIAILLMKNLEGGDIDVFANKVFNNWKLGDAKKDNGVLFLVALEERQMRIEV